MTLSTDVIVFSTADWAEANWTNNQRVSQSLAQEGFRVLYLESLGLRAPQASKRDLKRIGQRLLKSMRGLRHVEPNVWVFSPLVIPMHHLPLVQWINQKILVTTVRCLSLWLKFRHPILWAYNPVIESFQAQLQSSLLVYHCVDDLTTVPGISADVIQQAEANILKAADLVFVTSLNLQEKLGAIAPNKVHYFPNVADYAHFSQARQPGDIPSDVANIPEPRIGFIGAINDYKLDFHLIATIAKRHPDWHWVFVGGLALMNNSQALPSDLSQPNIHFLGYRPYDTLPHYLRSFTVSVLPCLLNDYTKSMFPMKFFEYLAAGRPIISTRLPALSDYEQAYLSAESIDEFEVALMRAIAGQTPDLIKGIELAQTHTWQSRCQQMLALMEN
ncbi:MAG: glycosyltransferase, partial [Cyanobacteria bacterium J06650_10]